MKPYTELNLGFSDAVNYKQRPNKELFNKFFIESPILDEIVKTSKYFLIGDKGTGKTAYAVYLSNNNTRNTISNLNYIYETEYSKFITLKNSNNLILSDYTSIWKVLLLLLFSMQIEKGENGLSQIINYSKYNALKEAVRSFYNNAFAPEIHNCLTFVENSEAAIKVIGTHLGTELNKSKTSNQSNTNFQLNLMTLEKLFKDSLSSLKLSCNHILFVDGIDIRPRNIQFEDYLECVKGLANAVWQLNNDFFANIRDSHGRMKVVLLVRPDIFAQLGLQNLNNKVRDNSVLLDWHTIYPQYRSSLIFQLADRMLNVQQDEKYPEGECWDNYFPFKNKDQEGNEHDSFVSFLRFSTFRPREIITLMSILQEYAKKNTRSVISKEDFNNPEIRSRYSDYLLGEIKNYLEFYHTEKEYELFLKFFEYLNGKAFFTYDEYMTAYDEYADYIESYWDTDNLPEQFSSSSKFLQFLYDLNVICYISQTETKNNHYHWAYRDKSYSDVYPKVQENQVYKIHYGLQKAFDTGIRLIKRRQIKKKKE